MGGRAAVAVVAGALLAGCVNSQPLGNSLAPPAQAAEPQAAEPVPDPSRKTLASRVLGAIALERVTGRKPDPARLAEAN